MYGPGSAVTDVAEIVTKITMLKLELSIDNSHHFSYNVVAVSNTCIDNRILWNREKSEQLLRDAAPAFGGLGPLRKRSVSIGSYRKRFGLPCL